MNVDEDNNPTGLPGIPEVASDPLSNGSNLSDALEEPKSENDPSDAISDVTRSVPDVATGLPGIREVAPDPLSNGSNLSDAFEEPKPENDPSDTITDVTRSALDASETSEDMADSQNNDAPDESPPASTSVDGRKSGIFMGALKKVRFTVRSTASSTVDHAVKLGNQVGSQAKQAASQAMSVAEDVTVTVANSAMNMLTRDEEGNAHDAGFVTFTKLSAVHGALQMVQHEVPFVMDTEPAPEPKEIFWSNVGKPAKAEFTGRLISLALTVLLCLFWTIPGELQVDCRESDSLPAGCLAYMSFTPKCPSLSR
jgi:hypothetical protein